MSCLCLPSSVLDAPQPQKHREASVLRRPVRLRSAGPMPTGLAPQTLTASRGQAQPSPLAPVVQMKPEIKTCVEYTDV